MFKFIINFDNIHCDKCVTTIESILSNYYQIIPIDNLDDLSTDNLTKKQVYFYYVADSNQVRLFGNDDIFQINLKKLLSKLNKVGFHILSWEIFDNNQLANSSNETNQHETTDTDGLFDVVKIYNKLFKRNSKVGKNHLKYCKACQNKDKLNDSDTSSSEETKVEIKQQEYRASFLIQGMTCSSCVQSIDDALKPILNFKPGEFNYSINLLQQSLVAIIPNKQIINKVIDEVNDLGFECKLIEVLPIETSITTKVTGLIEGMTCSACATSIYNSLQDLPFILESGINIMTKTGTFVIENESQIPKLQEAIEDCGFEFKLVSNEKINYLSSKKKSRSVMFKVNGMFCSHCPEIILNYLSQYGESVIIDDSLTLQNPIIKFTYIPSENVNIRKFLFDLNHISDDVSSGYKINENEGTFQCELVKPVSIDEQINKLAHKELLGLSIRLIIATIFAIPTFIFGIVAMALLRKNHPFRKWVEEPIWVGNVSRDVWILLILSTPVYFFAADTFHRKAIKEVKSLWIHKNSFTKRLFKFGSMNLLMCLGTSVAYFASIVLLGISANQEKHTEMGFHTTYFDSVVFLTFFLLIGKLLQAYSKLKTSNAINKLSDLKQSEATLLENDQEAKIDVELLEIGDTIKISTGESPPIDCVITKGRSEFDESALTGESTPIKHIDGHQIFSGTVNIGNSSIIAKVTSLTTDSLLNQIVSTVRDGQLRKAPMEKVADLITGYFVPVIVFLAITTWVIWLSLGFSGKLPQSYLDIDVGGWTIWSLDFAIAVFVIACPCGIGLAAPTALFVGTGLAAKYGILAKGGGVAFQDGANTNVVCFDKTGTLTMGKLTVTNYAFITDIPKFLTLQVSRDLELSSNHPISKCVKTFIDKLASKLDVSLSINKIPEVETVPGKGLKGIVTYEDDSEWDKYKPTEAILGNESLFEDYDIEISKPQQYLLNQWKSECKSVILVGIKSQVLFQDSNFHLIFMMTARDQLRPDSKEIIKSLHSKKIDTWMITGDNKLTASSIAKEIGIPESNVISQILPNEKEFQIKRIRQIKPNSIVAMVGDGINDAPALANSDVGIALSSGSDLAITSSDFILLNKIHPLISLITLFDLSRSVFHRIYFNFGWALVYNVCGIPIAAGVIYPYKNSRLDPVWASAAMALSSISVVLSSLALKFYRPKINPKDFKIDDLEEIEAEESNI
ncbi:unnamed protein product [Candida verbasci]|uniref:HMA domain-containing protein n=1 Tax=Candida verbasci TaxID=1227364 RepID=A0A9W4XCN1_9ASCO|nr:unnamed protein product [Candida verbasci]